MKKNWQKFCFCRGLLHRKVEDEKPQLVPPAKYIPIVCKALRDDMGHQGYEKTLSASSGQECPKIRELGCCLRFKGKPDRAPLVANSNIRTIRTSLYRLSQGWFCPKFWSTRVISLDSLWQYQHETSQQRQQSKLSCPSSKTSASRNGYMLIKATLCQLLGVEKSRTTSFHPMGNGSCERMNQTLISMLGTLPEHKKKDWTSHIGMLVVAYNSNKSDSTGFSPYFLMFGKNRGSLLIICFLFSQNLEVITSQV